MKTYACLILMSLLVGPPAWSDTSMDSISASLKVVPDFPKPGIQFIDISPLLASPADFSKVIKRFEQRYLSESIDVIVGLESRGFLIGAVLAHKMGLPFVMIRKPGKIPGETLEVSYAKEYGVDKLQIQKGSLKSGQKVLLVDDLLATGGSLIAAAQLVRLAGGEVIEAATLIKLKDISNQRPLDFSSYSLLSF